MRSSKYSVLISVYHRENVDYFNDAMASIWEEQTVPPSQIVLVKDGPQTAEMDCAIAEWSERLGDVLTLVVLPENRGLAMALNAGLGHCQYDLVARMDADDIALPERFEKQLAKFQEDDQVGIVGTFAREICEQGNPGVVRRMPTNHERIHQNLFTCPFIHPTVMFKKSLIEAVGGYNERLKRRQDYELWFRCGAASMKFANVPEPLLLYRFGVNTHSRQSLKDVIRQARIGSAGVKSLQQSYWKRLACYVPAVRGMFPEFLQHLLYRGMKFFDPRSRTYG